MPTRRYDQTLRQGDRWTPEDEGYWRRRGRSVRPYLPRLVEIPAAAARLDHAITDDSPTQPTARRLRVLLDSYEGTAWSLTEALKDALHYRPPYLPPASLPPAL